MTPITLRALALRSGSRVRLLICTSALNAAAALTKDAAGRACRPDGLRMVRIASGIGGFRLLAQLALGAGPQPDPGAPAGRAGPQSIAAEPEEVLAALDAVTAEDIQRVAQDIIDEGPYLAVIGPFDDAARFEKLLG